MTIPPEQVPGVGAPAVREARTDDGPRLARLLGGDDRDAIDRATSLVPDADEVGRLLLVGELHGEVVGYANVVWIHPLHLTGPEAHVAELVVADHLDDVPDGAAGRVRAALRTCIADHAASVGAVRITGPGWRTPLPPPVVRELAIGATAAAVPALRELRPHLPEDDAQVVARIDEVQRPQGYRLFAVFGPGEDPAVAVAGFRRLANLAWGDILYIDDLVTRAHARRRGAAAALLTAVDDEARRLQLDAVHLDSGHGPDRASAHRAYLGHGYRISSHHFSRSLADGPDT